VRGARTSQRFTVSVSTQIFQSHPFLWCFPLVLTLLPTKISFATEVVMILLGLSILHVHSQNYLGWPARPGSSKLATQHGFIFP
jgi:hypothetical protein